MGKEINNQGGKIFIEEIIIDWYDGPVVALAASYEVQVFEQIKDLVDNDQAKESRYSFLHFAFQSHRLGRIFLHGISIPCEKLKCTLLLLRVYSKLAGQGHLQTMGYTRKGLTREWIICKPELS